MALHFVIIVSEHIIKKKKEVNNPAMNIGFTQIAEPLKNFLFFTMLLFYLIIQILTSELI